MVKNPPTWRASAWSHGPLTKADRDELPEAAFAFPRQRWEPLTDAAHVRTAIEHFSRVTDVSDADRDLAFANIRKAATFFDVDVDVRNWHDIAKRAS